MTQFKFNMTLRTGAVYNWTRDIPDSFFGDNAYENILNSDVHSIMRKIFIMESYVRGRKLIGFQDGDEYCFICQEDIEELSISILNKY